MSALLNERVVTAQPSLIRLLGLTKAVVLQQLHWHLAAAGHGIEHDGEMWYPVTCTVLAAEMGLAPDAVRRALVALEADELVLSCQPEHYQRRKWYRVNAENVLLCPIRRFAASEDADLPVGSRESADSPTKPLRQEKAEEQAPLRQEKRLEKRAGGESSKPPRARSEAQKARDGIWDALAGFFDPPQTTSERSLWGKVVSELVAVEATPPAVIGACVELRKRDWKDPTPRAVVSHWASLTARPREPERGSLWDRLAERDARRTGA